MVSRLTLLTLIYVLCVPALGYLWTLSEMFAYVLFFSSFAWLAFGVTYEVWKYSRRPKRMESTIQQAKPRLGKWEKLVVNVERAISATRLRQVLLEKMRIQLNLEFWEIEKILENPERLREEVEDEDLLELLLFQEVERKKSQKDRMAWLTKVLDKVERWGT